MRTIPVVELEIVVKDGARPARQRAYDSSAKHRAEIKRQCELLLAMGIIQRSQSDWAAPVTMVAKALNMWRMCVDYRLLNAHTKRDMYPIPIIGEIHAKLGGNAVFSTLDLKSGYYHVKVATDSIEKTAFRTHESFV